MNILLISPYHGGSHRAWAEGYQRHSTHMVNLLTMPARFWKWRLHGGAFTLARRFLEIQSHTDATNPDLLLATDMLDLTTFLALTRNVTSHIPVALYMHENQLTYPLPTDPDSGPMRRQKGERDLHYAFINLASMLAADRVVFNSQYHHDNLLDALPRFLKHYPEFNELVTLRPLHEKSSVLPIGIDAAELFKKDNGNSDNSATNLQPGAPLILWNQRWEYDKNPAAFFSALYQIRDEGIPFRLALCGESFRQGPAEFEVARARLTDHIVHIGHAPTGQYRALLRAANIVVSTAIHEFFGISIVEAILCQTFPILSARLSYPELLPASFHEQCLYDDESGLVKRLKWALTHPRDAARISGRLAPTIQEYTWQAPAPRYDAYFQALRG